MPIEFPEPLQNFGCHDDDLMGKWLNQFTTVTNDLPKDRIRMPAMLTSDNLSTWLTTRYATRNKSKVRELGLEVDNKIRRERKKSSSGRCYDDVDSEGYFNWLTPKKAKISECDVNDNMKTSVHSTIVSDEPVDNGLKQSVSSEPSNLLSRFIEQSCQMNTNDWYKETISTTNIKPGLLAPYFEKTGSMKVDDWLAKNIANNQDPSLSEWLHCTYRSNSEQSSGCVTPTTSGDEPQINENDSNRWLANEASLPNMDDDEEKQDIINDDDDESLLDGLEGMNIGSNNIVLDDDWLSNANPDHSSNKTKGNWFLDDFGSFSWTAPKETPSSMETSPNTTGNIRLSQGPSLSLDRSSPLNLNDWLIVPNGQTDDNSTDDGSSIVVLSIHN